MEKTASEVIVDQLAEAGVKYVFGIPGHSILGVVEGLRLNTDIEFISVRHEETASLMASAYAKLTDQLGVCLGIAGPGATNLMTGLYDAKMDRAPVLAITGQVALQFIGRDVLQEIDQHSLFESVTRFNKVITSPVETAEITLLAIKNAVVHRGVSHLGVPMNIQSAKTSTMAKPIGGRIPTPRIRPPDDLISEAVQLIDRAKQPMIIAGWGARFAPKQVLGFAEKIGAPIATTFKAKGLISEFHPQSVGVHGTVGWDSARAAASIADLVIVLGSSFSQQTAIPQSKPILQIDYDPLVVGKRFSVELGLWGTVEDTIPMLATMVQRKDNAASLKFIKEEKEQWLSIIESVTSSDHTPIHPARILNALQAVLPDDAIVSIDVGDNSYWFGKYFQMKKQSLLISGYLATMGFGFAGALAAGFANPDRKAVSLTGDGAFAMLMADFTTAVTYNLPLVVIVYNNSELSMITHEQAIEKFPKFATELKNPNFADFAVSSGGLGFEVTNPTDLESVLKEAFNANKPTIVDVHTDPSKFWMDRMKKEPVY
jgi:thiamine pyrophosphate-dependent acetolactate synthase large subunit-like protein